MLIDGLKLTDTSVAENLIIQSGDDLPLTNLNKGELFFLNNVGLHVYNGDEWEKAGSGDAPAATWSDLSGKPAVIAAGVDAGAARTAIGAASAIEVGNIAAALTAINGE